MCALVDLADASEVLLAWVSEGNVVSSPSEMQRAYETILRVTRHQGQEVLI